MIRSRLIVVASIGAALFAAAAPALARAVDHFTERVVRATATVLDFGLAMLALAFPASPRTERAVVYEAPARVLGRSQTRSFRERFFARMPGGHGRAPLATAFAGA